ncbi:hypothetical protein ACIRP2_25410 [Streptomyces sp. NPDC101194]|uniref:hypothetical protein n=1 Tax=Streptomyces sp. NPDC101194 TaxID=3366127 RepID=UPI0037F5401D
MVACSPAARRAGRPRGRWGRARTSSGPRLPGPPRPAPDRGRGVTATVVGEAFTEHARVLPGAETAPRREAEEFFARHGMPLPMNRVGTTSFLTVRQLLLEADVVAAPPGLFIRDDPRIVRPAVPLDPIGHSVGPALSAARAPGPSAQAPIRSPEGVAAHMDRRGAEGDDSP